jgi:hypothetical protein
MSVPADGKWLMEAHMAWSRQPPLVWYVGTASPLLWAEGSCSDTSAVGGARRAHLARPARRRAQSIRNALGTGLGAVGSSAEGCRRPNLMGGILGSSVSST